MGKSILLNSAEWCDIIFEGKNKAYGAYEMRQTSSKRHIVAFGCILVLTALVSVTPLFLKAVNGGQKDLLGGYTTTVNISDIPLDKPEDEPIVQTPEVLPPPVKLVKSQMFTPPIITDASEVTAENQMLSQDELSKSKGIISTVTYETDNTDGIDPGELLAKHRVITSQVVDAPPLEFAEVKPQYPGGESELMKYLSNNLKYPALASEIGIEGRVIIKFVVGKDGNISNVQVLKGIDPSCDKEAMRVVKSMNRWIPGSQNGNHVAVYFTLPIMFRLQK